MSALAIALLAFDHDVGKVHDQLVQAGAATVLMRCLDRAMGEEDGWEEVDPICQLLCMSFRCSDQQGAQSFTGIGAELCPLLFSVLFISNSYPSLETPPSALQLLRRLATLEVNVPAMSSSAQLLRCFRQIIEVCDIQTDRERLVDVLHVLVGLSQHRASKEFIMDSPGLCDSIVSRISESCRPGCELNLETANLLRNLAYHPGNKATMAGKKGLIKLLVLLAGDRKVETRLAAIESLKHLASDGHGRSKLASQCKGKLLKTLFDATGYEETQEQALETMMSFVSRSTAFDMCKDEKLLLMLTNLASCGSDSKSSTIAAQTVKRLATHVPANHASHGALLDVILKMASSEFHRIRFWGAKAFVEQSLIPGSSFFMVRIHQVVQTLTQLARDDNVDVQAAAVEALQNLAADTTNVKRLAMDSDLLEVFVSNAEGSGEILAAARRHAVQALLSLASHRSTKRRIAKQYGLVASLSRYAMSEDNDDELKRAAIHGVILLAPLM
jgi:hypothetical protein